MHFPYFMLQKLTLKEKIQKYFANFQQLGVGFQRAAQQLSVCIYQLSGSAIIA
jgi:hypothetical protein